MKAIEPAVTGLPQPNWITWKNPVWPGYFADPFLLQWRGEYFAYGTSESPHLRSDGSALVFNVLRSTDLARWRPAGFALHAPSSASDWAYWAPEVAEHEGAFYLYYSSAPPGADDRHRIRVAKADHPAGPFVDQGPVLPESEGFCIDAHPFRDARDGKWYLFFAKDYFDERTGTGLAVIPLRGDMLRADGSAQAVVRANADWQIYERDRSLYGRSWSAWHTVEGPCVAQHGGRYFCFYSGGNWQTHEYGVSYAVADHPLGPWTHTPHAGPCVLRQVPGKVLGPGHNSYVLGPDGRTEFLVYHAWDPQRTARRMCIDRLEWTADGPRCSGPTTTTQTA